MEKVKPWWQLRGSVKKSCLVWYNSLPPPLISFLPISLSSPSLSNPNENTPVGALSSAQIGSFGSRSLLFFALLACIISYLVVCNLFSAFTPCFLILSLVLVPLLVNVLSGYYEGDTTRSYLSVCCVCDVEISVIYIDHFFHGKLLRHLKVFDETQDPDLSEEEGCVVISDDYLRWVYDYSVKEDLEHKEESTSVLYLASTAAELFSLGFSLVDGADRLLYCNVLIFSDLIVHVCLTALVTGRFGMFSAVKSRFKLNFFFPNLVPVIYGLVILPMDPISGFVVHCMMVVRLEVSFVLRLFWWEIKFCRRQTFFVPAEDEDYQDEAHGISSFGSDFYQMAITIKNVLLMRCESCIIDSSSWYCSCSICYYIYCYWYKLIVL